jgi:hypothetical protein
MPLLKGLAQIRQKEKLGQKSFRSAKSAALDGNTSFWSRSR